MKEKITIFLLVVCFLYTDAESPDTLKYKGQVSLWTGVNPDLDLPVWLGGRFIPQINFEHKLKRQNKFDLEASANLYGNIGFYLSDTFNFNRDLKPYRLWVRHSSEQFELRVGLQKINFGSASILRPLMWFDRIDPRDPLQLTDGVWGTLARYYFLNNANVWLWFLYGNKNPKGWESIETNHSIPEIGGRVQNPFPHGEVALTYHHRTADSRDYYDSLFQFTKIPENRIGFDAKIDLLIGCWLEASWSKKEKKMGILTNQQLINMGIDYTFGVGNGLTVIFEQLIASYSEKPFKSGQKVIFSLLNMTYPISLFDNLTAIVYYDWTNQAVYNFVNWQRQFNKISFYLMGWLNPKEYNIPTQESGQNMFAGYGGQAMVVYNF